jgi:hypothetical protein
MDDVGSDTALLARPGIPAEDAAAASARPFAWHLSPRAIGAALVESIGPERARDTVEVALRAEPSPAALALAVGDADVAAAHVLRARELTDDPNLGLRLAIAREGQHRIVDALQELRDALADYPYLQVGQLLRGACCGEWLPGTSTLLATTRAHPGDRTARGAPGVPSAGVAGKGTSPCSSRAPVRRANRPRDRRTLPSRGGVGAPGGTRARAAAPAIG